MTPFSLFCFIFMAVLALALGVTVGGAVIALTWGWLKGWLSQ